MVSGCAMLSACAGAGLLGNKPEDAGAFPASYEEVIRGRLATTLKDPYSAQVEIGRPSLGQCQRGIYGTFHGWVVPVTVNAKNGFGAYTGYQTTYAWFADGLLVRESGSPTLCP